MRFLGRLILVPLALIFAIPAGVVGLIGATVFDPVLGAFGCYLYGRHGSRFGRRAAAP